MRWFKLRDDRTLNSYRYESTEKYYADLVNSFKNKANHNKHETQFCFVLIITCTTAAPVFLSFGEDAIWSKIVPAALSLIAAATTSWVQFRKPERLWSIYRRAQRELEQERIKYDFSLEEYKDDDKEKVFASKASSIAFEAHCKWEGILNSKPEASKGGETQRPKVDAHE